MATFWDILNQDLTPEQKAKEIERIGNAERRAYDIEGLKNKARIGAGALLQGVSFHPVFNIPYVGTGIGGAMFDAGNAIVEGEKLPDIAKQAGRGFAIGETVGAIPYAGKAISKTKVGNKVFDKVGNVAGNLFDKLKNTNVGQKITEIAPKVEDVLLTDIKAFNPFKQTQTAYHGSPYDFARFNNEAIGTGEGAQAHGLGHYVAKSKGVADERYRKRLSSGNYEIAGKKLDDPFQEATLKDVMAKGKSNVIAKYEKDLLESKKIIDDFESKYTKNELFQNDDLYLPYDNARDRYMNTLERYDFIKNIDENSITKNEGQLYKLSIPKDDVLLREHNTYSKQPLAVQKSLDKALKDYLNLAGIEDIGIDTYTNPGSIERLLHTYKYSPQMNAGNFYDVLSNYHPNSSKFLDDYGIKGISYNGGIDGEARVIFNPDDIEIVRKYFNQPNLFELLLGKTPNTGAVSSNLYDLMTKEEKVQNLWDKRKVWGTPFQKASGNPELAIETLKKYQRGFVPNADNNGVDFVWGKYIPSTNPNKKGGGYGLAHIEGRRFEDGYNGTDFLDIIPNLMQNGNKFYKDGHPGRYYKELGNQEAIIRTDYNGQPWHWLNSAYFKEIDK